MFALFSNTHKTFVEGDTEALSSLEVRKRILNTQSSQTSHDPELLTALFQARSSDPGVLAFLSYVTKYMQLHNMALPINFAPDHPVEEAGRSGVFIFIIYATPIIC